MLDITKGGNVKQGSQQNGSHSELDTYITCLCMDFLWMRKLVNIPVLL